MNYKHLHYFLHVAECGGVVRASERLHVSPQTISGQLQVLEQRLGKPLFAKVHGRLQLTDTGRLVRDYARDIFALGAELESVVREGSAQGRPLEFRVGVADAVSKAVVRRLLEPVLVQGPPVRLVCLEWRLERLLSELASHRLDLVFADAPPAARSGGRMVSRRLDASPVAVCGTAALRRRHAGPFPDCLDGAPMLMPGEDSALGRRLRAWLDASAVRPKTLGEIDDGALAQELGSAGHAFFVCPLSVAAELGRRLRVGVIGVAESVADECHAISIERRLSHPCVAAVFAATPGGAAARPVSESA
jgi:LysR family transcriptional activator of nhaA